MQMGGTGGAGGEINDSHYCVLINDRPIYGNLGDLNGKERGMQTGDTGGAGGGSYALRQL